MMWCLLFVPDDKDPLEFSKGVPKHFPFFHRETGSGVGSTQCCQEILEGMEVVLNFIAEREREIDHGVPPFSHVSAVGHFRRPSAGVCGEASTLRSIRRLCQAGFAGFFVQILALEFSLSTGILRSQTRDLLIRGPFLLHPKTFLICNLRIRDISECCA